MTLDSPIVRVTIEESDGFFVQSFNCDGSEKQLSEKDIIRFKKHQELTVRYLEECDYCATALLRYNLIINSHIPSGIGLASSAAVFSAVSKAYAGILQKQGIDFTDEQISIIARLGSGSACRSVHGGFSAMDAGFGESIDSAKAVRIADETHWALHDIVIAPSLEEKKIGSTQGHHIADTSPHFGKRLTQIPRRQQECIDAILNRDFEKLQRVSEEDALDLHKVAETSNPPLQYLHRETHRIIGEIKELRTREHLSVLFTMDAGQTVHLVCEQSAVSSIKEYAHAQKNCTVFETKIGSGARVVGTSIKTNAGLLRD